MADVVIMLSLSRRSGILAAAVSAVNRAGLQFGTHRFVETDAGQTLRLNAESDGELIDPEPVVAELSAIRGVDAVIDVLSDSRSLMHPLAQPALDAAEDVAAVNEASESAPEPQVAARPVDQDQVEPEPEPELVVAQPETELEQEPEPEPEPEYVVESELIAFPTQLARAVARGADTPAQAKAPESTDSVRQPAADGQDEDVMARRSMIRRRRRRR